MSERANRIEIRSKRMKEGEGFLYLLSFIFCLLSFGVSSVLADQPTPSDTLARAEGDTLFGGIVLSGVCDGRAVVLTWTKEEDFDPAWYVVYRDTSAHLLSFGFAQDKRLRSEQVSADAAHSLGVVPDTFYVDDEVDPGKVYYYSVSAVDTVRREQDRSEEIAVRIADEVEVVLEPTEVLLDGLPTEYSSRFPFPVSRFTEQSLLSSSLLGLDASPLSTYGAVDATTGGIALYFGMAYSASDSIYAEWYIAPNGAGAHIRISVEAVHGEAVVNAAYRDGEDWRELEEDESPIINPQSPITKDQSIEGIRIKTRTDEEEVGVELLIHRTEVWVTDRAFDPSVRYHLRKPDNEAPMPPTALSVVPEIGQNRLAWIASPDSDVAQVRIYRRTPAEGQGGRGAGGGSPLLLCSSAPLPVFVDTSAIADVAYIYQVSAVDRFGNESARSEPVTGTALPPDALGPMVSEVQVVPDTVTVGEGVYVWAALSDSLRGGSPIAAVEALFDSSGEFGTGIPFEAKDGWLDGPNEEIEGTLFFPGRERRGPYRLYLHGMDARGNWGPFAVLSVFVEVPKDTVPPPKVEDVQAMDVVGDERGALVVMWSPSSAPDAVYYRVYRTDAGGDGAMMVLGRTEKTSFFDTTSALEGAYLYGVTAVDSSGNEGMLEDMVGPVRPLDDVAPRVVEGSFRPAPGATWVSSEAPIVFEVADEGVGVDMASLQIVVDGEAYTAERPDSSASLRMTLMEVAGSDSAVAVTVRPERGFDFGEEVHVAVSVEDRSGNRFEEEYVFFIEPWHFRSLASDSVVASEGDSLMVEGKVSVSSASLRMTLLIPPGALESDGWIHLGTVEGAPELPEGIVAWGDIWAIAGDSTVVGKEDRAWTLWVFSPTEEEPAPEHLWLFVLDEANIWRRAGLLVPDPSASLRRSGTGGFEGKIVWPLTAESLENLQGSKGAGGQRGFPPAPLLLCSSAAVLAFGAYSEEEPPYLVEADPAQDEEDVSLEAPIRLRIRDEGAGVDTSSVRLEINGVEVDSSEVAISWAEDQSEEDRAEGKRPMEVLVRYEPTISWALGDTVYVGIAAADLAGMANWLREEYRFVVVGDTTAPQIGRIKMGPFEAGMDGKIAVEVHDEGPGDSLRFAQGQALSVRLFYGMGGAASYDSLDMIVEEGWYTGIIPGERIGMRDVRVRIRASDGRNEATFPEQGWAYEEVRISGEMLPVERPPGSYRMFSLPFVPEEDRALGFLEDALGPYDPERWRVLRRNERGGYDEVPDLVSARPGEAFYLMVREPIVAIPVGTGRSVRSDRSYEVLLHPGWNQVGVPFAFPVSWASIMEASGYPDLEGPWVFDGTNRFFGFAQNDVYGATMLEPWKGYWIRSRREAPVILSVPPQETAAGGQVGRWATSPAPLRRGEGAGWVMRVSVWADSLGDPDNFIGISEEAAQGWDRSDLSEPPVVGPSLVLYFPHPDWEGHPTKLAGDFRPYEGETLTWDFVVEAADTALREATLTFEGVADVPEGLRVVLVDPEREERMDLSGADSYSFAFNGDVHRRSMALIVEGDLFEAAAESSYVSAAAKPVWLQNYPNPFNQQTLITYTVPKEALPEGAAEAQCQLIVYNMLGQEMFRLVDAPKAPGTYSLEWDGREVGAGIYFLKLTVGNLEVMKRVMLVK